jgi:BirA family biotin operon repressor/biotin-[acetyl-CoA-carboxylase] ligase
LLTGVALHTAVEAVTGLRLALKWPNDLLAGDDRKLAGILVQVAGEKAVVGVGLNVSTTAAELDTPAATSLALAGARTTDRTALLRAILDELGPAYLRWVASEDTSALADDYRRRCTTIGCEVHVTSAVGAQRGQALDVDGDGRLLVRLIGAGALGPAGEQRAVAAADVVHVRTTGRVVG